LVGWFVVENSKFFSASPIRHGIKSYSLFFHDYSNEGFKKNLRNININFNLTKN
jgi:hypothetical protein